MYAAAMTWALCLMQAPLADRAAQARAFIGRLSAGEFTAAVETFDDTMKKVMPADKLKETWVAVTTQVGPFREALQSRSENRGKYELVFITCQFEKAKLDVRVAFDSENRIAGLGFVPSRPPVEYKPPNYVKPEAVRSRPITLNEGAEFPLGGTLTMPTGDGPFPAVVLVHGSGAHDRDETLGPNKPFRDLAEGLSSRGVAVLRYDKRNFIHAAKLKPETFTLRDEVLDDALAAVALLRKTPGIDARRIFILGHSLGGMAAPKLATLDPNLAGIVIMAGAARPLEDVIIDQLAYLSSLPGPNGEAVKEMLEKVRLQAEKLRDPKAAAEWPASERLMGMPPAYLAAVRALDPAGTAGKLSCRVLVLQGDRDYQVTIDDFAQFEKALAGKSTATLKRFAKLNHLFMDGQGKATPAEYEKPGHVAAEVVNLIADWVQQ